MGYQKLPSSFPQETSIPQLTTTTFWLWQQLVHQIQQRTHWAGPASYRHPGKYPYPSPLKHNNPPNFYIPTDTTTPLDMNQEVAITAVSASYLDYPQLHPSDSNHIVLDSAQNSLSPEDKDASTQVQIIPPPQHLNSPLITIINNNTVSAVLLSDDNNASVNIVITIHPQSYRRSTYHCWCCPIYNPSTSCNYQAISQL